MFPLAQEQLDFSLAPVFPRQGGPMTKTNFSYVKFWHVWRGTGFDERQTYKGPQLVWSSQGWNSGGAVALHFLGHFFLTYLGGLPSYFWVATLNYSYDINYQFTTPLQRSSDPPLSFLFWKSGQRINSSDSEWQSDFDDKNLSNTKIDRAVNPSKTYIFYKTLWLTTSRLSLVVETAYN